ncbi:MAG TPA: hypothetical protein VN667_08055, partial [Burkholderiales bacterium]|nr:hypothetical protein [Burkholderiales bacterium]
NAGTGATVVAGNAFNNTGTVESHIGTIALQVGGNGNGTYVADTGATLNFSGAAMNAGSISGAASSLINITGATVNVSGTYSATTTHLASGALNINGTGSTSQYIQSGGALGGTGSFSVLTGFNQTAGTIGSTLSSLSISQASGNLSIGGVGAVNNLSLTAAAGILSINGGGVNVTGGSGSTISLGGTDMNILAPVNAGTGTVTINNLSGGAVTLGGGLSGFGLSNAELNEITAGLLVLHLSPVTVDGAVNLGSTVGSLLISAGSMNVNNSFVTAGNLTIGCSSGDLSVTASSLPVILQGSSVTLATTAGNINVTGGSIAGAGAAINASAGDLVFFTPSTNSLNLTPNAGGAVLAASNAISGSTGAVIVGPGTGPSGFSAPSYSVVTSTGTISSAPPPVTSGTTDTSVPADTALQNALAAVDSATTPKSNTNTNTTTPPTPNTGTPGGTGTAGTTGSPTLTDPNGTVGGEAGSFGGESSSTSPGGSNSDSGKTRASGKKPAACKA